MTIPVDIPEWQILLMTGPIAAKLLALATLRGQDGGRDWRLARHATSLALLLALSGAATLVLMGDSRDNQAWGLRRDALSATMTVLVSFVGWVIVRGIAKPPTENGT